MKKSEQSLLNRIKCVNENPLMLKDLISKICTSQITLKGGSPKDRHEEHVNLYAVLKKSKVLLTDGEAVFLEDVINELKELCTDEIHKNITAENFYSTYPFIEFGNIAVYESSAYPAYQSLTKVKDLFKATTQNKQTRIPVNNALGDDHSHTFWLHCSNDWWSTIIYTKYEAETWSTATGLEAADVLGGLYQEAKHACQTLIVPPPGDPNNFILAFIKAAACNYAKNAPEVAWQSQSIRTIVCKGALKNIHGDCIYFSDISPDGISFDCNQHRVENTSGPVEATAHEWAGGYLSVSSRHEIQFNSNTSLAYELCG